MIGVRHLDYKGNSMARFIETRRLDETVIYINADRVDYVYEAPNTGHAVVSFGTQELGIQMSASDFRAKAEGIGVATGDAHSPLPDALDPR